MSNQSAPAGTAGTSRTRRPRHGRRGRCGVMIVGAGVLALIVVGLAVRDTSPVGHFTSGSGRDAFAAAYARAMRDLPQPDATLDIRTGYGVVRFYRFDGAQPQLNPLVLLPGRASASPMWAANLPALRKIRTVYTVDLLGEPGASIQDRPIEDDEDQARWLHEALAQLPVDQVHLVGASIGGWTAMNVALRHPEQIASVTVLDPAMTFAGMSTQAIVRSIPASVRWFPKSWRDSFNSWTAEGAPVRDVPVADMIESGMQHYALRLPAPTRFAQEDLATLDLPVLVIMAGRSVMHDSAAAARLAEHTLRKGTILVYEDASHALNGEYPDRIAADVAAFLTTTGQE